MVRFDLDAWDLKDRILGALKNSKWADPENPRASRRILDLTRMVNAYRYTVAELEMIEAEVLGEIEHLDNPPEDECS